MRHIILVLIALVAFGGLLPSIIAAPVLVDKPATTPTPSESSLETTPSMAAFLNDSWTPSTFVAPLENEAVGVQRSMTRNNTTLANSTYAIYDYMNDNYASPAASSPIYSASAAGKDRTIAWTGESIYDFLNDAWSPKKAIQTYEQTPYKQHQMN